MISPRCPQCCGLPGPGLPPRIRVSPHYCHLHEIGNKLLDHVPPGYRAVVIVLDATHGGAASRDLSPVEALDVLASHVARLRDVVIRTEVS